MTSNVLAIEGSKAQRAILERLFNASGMTPTLLADTNSLTETLEATHFDFICLGMQIPGAMNGLETCRFIREQSGYQYTPIVLLTTQESGTTQREAFSSGITDIFNRHEFDELDAYLKRHLERNSPLEGRVLYIEDSVSQQLSMMSFLKDSGLEVDAFETGEDAWQAFQSGEYDMVLTDIVLPGELSGLHIVHKIRRMGGRKGDVPIIAITGYDDSARRIELLQRGVNDYVSKPVLPHEVMVRVRTLIKNRQLISHLKQQNQKVEQQSKDQLSFLASISHDVRTPLNGILGILDLIRSDDLSDHHKHLLEIAMQSGEHLVSIIDDVLDLSRAEVNEFVIERQPTMIRKVASNVVQNLKPQADRKNLRLNLFFSNTMPELVLGDAKRFYQVLMNLIGNAIKFTDKGGVEINLDYLPSELPKQPGMLHGEVKDTGRGIPSVECSTIFNKFHQVDAFARSKGGSGLGLAIVRTIIEAWGGSLGVESKLGNGARFWFNIPLDVVESKSDSSMTTHHEQPIFQGDELKVLMVEDNTVNQLVTGSMLEQMSVSYCVAENGQDALEKLEQDRFNLILMDCQMPVMDGYKAAATIRHSNKEYEGIYIIALTASAMLDEERKCYRMGMNDFVAKPVLYDTLVKAMNKAYKIIR